MNEFALVSTDRGLYLFDRARDLLLLDFCPLPAEGGSRGGAVYARGDTIVVVGENGLWSVTAD